jgi:hypothetical protein
MSGWPVWLASASLRDRHGRIRPAKDWDAATTAKVSATLDVVLDGVGDDEHEREFRMCITLCRHRALTQDEFDGLPDWWHKAPAHDLAGGPVEVLWSKNVPETPGTQPCHKPTRQHVGPGLWLPLDCGECPPCEARASARSLPGMKIRRPW